MDIQELLRLTVDNNASDLHISAGQPPILRIDGELSRLNLPPLDEATANTLLYNIMDDNQRKTFEAELEVDFSFEVAGLSRFRVNVFQQHRGISGAFRAIPMAIKSFEDLGLPDNFKKLCQYPRGLVLVTGATGSGKSTTLAAMLDYINHSYDHHIITIEDPIEYVHTCKRSLINQRQIKRDTLNFTNALRAALREDPDVILVGEMRDLETMRLALTAAETGHLVFASLHTSSAAKTINRIIDAFPSGEKNVIRSILAESLQAVIAQSLVKCIVGGRVAVHEIMICNPAIQNLIREEKVAQIYSALQTGAVVGMHTLDQHLQKLVNARQITLLAAREIANDKNLF